MKINDLTRCPLESKSYKNRAHIEFKVNESLGTSEGSLFSSSLHIGTHIDYPNHKIGLQNSENPSIISYKSSEVLFLDYQKDTIICPRESNCRVILLKTRESELEYCQENYSWNFKHLNLEDGKDILSCFPRLEVLVIDSLSVGNPNNSKENDYIHRQILQKNILIIEDVKLDNWWNSYDCLFVVPTLTSLINIDSSFARVFQLQF